MGNRPTREPITIYYTVSLTNGMGIHYTSTQTSSRGTLLPLTVVGPVGRGFGYNDFFTFTSLDMEPITFEMTINFDLNYNTAVVSNLTLNPTNKTNIITFTLNSIDFTDNSGNVHNRSAVGQTTATYPATTTGFPCVCLTPSTTPPVLQGQVTTVPPNVPATVLQGQTGTRVVNFQGTATTTTVAQPNAIPGQTTTVPANMPATIVQY